MQLSADDYKNLARTFKNDVCAQCKICKDIKSPDFCADFFINLGQDFFFKLVVLVKFSRFEKEVLYKKLSTFEGFTALFCNSHICKLYSPARCVPLHMADCFQLFRSQDDKTPDDKLSRELADNWSAKVCESICRELDRVSADIELLPKKQKKRLLKMGKNSLGALQKAKNRMACGYSNKKKSNVVVNHPKKVITTYNFQRDENFATIAKNILEGKYINNINEDNDREQPNITGNTTPIKGMVYTELDLHEPFV
jgi:hypothetical protein